MLYIKLKESVNSPQITPLNRARKKITKKIFVFFLVRLLYTSPLRFIFFFLVRDKRFIGHLREDRDNTNKKK